MLSRLKTALRTLLRRTQVERELDEEMRHHLEQQTEQNIRLGMDPEEARFAAQSAGGAVDFSRWRSPSVTTGIIVKYIPSPGVATNRDWSFATPGRREVPDLCRNFSSTVCATTAESFWRKICSKTCVRC